MIPPCIYCGDIDADPETGLCAACLRDEQQSCQTCEGLGFERSNDGTCAVCFDCSGRAVLV